MTRLQELQNNKSDKTTRVARLFTRLWTTRLQNGQDYNSEKTTSLTGLQHIPRQQEWQDYMSDSKRNPGMNSQFHTFLNYVFTRDIELTCRMNRMVISFATTPLSQSDSVKIVGSHCLHESNPPSRSKSFCISFRFNEENWVWKVRLRVLLCSIESSFYSMLRWVQLSKLM